MKHSFLCKWISLHLKGMFFFLPHYYPVLMKIINYLLMPILGALAFCSCVQDGYSDLNAPIDMEVNCLGSINLPVGSTAPITIGELLGIDEFGIIDTDDEGNYVFNIDGPAASSLFSLEPVSIAAPERFNGSYVYECSGLPVVPGSDLTIEEEVPEFHVPISFEHDGMPSEITGIEGFEVNTRIDLSLSYNAAGVSVLTMKKGWHIDIPSTYVITKIDNGDFSMESGSNSIIANKDIRIASGKPVTIKATVSEIRIADLPEGQGLVAPGKFIYSDSLAIGGSLSLSSKDIKAPTLSDIEIILAAQLSEIKVRSVTGTVDTSIEMDSLIHEVDEVPEILQSATLDVHGAGILIKPCNDLPCAVRASFSLGTMNSDGNLAKVQIDNLLIEPGDTTEIYISENGNMVPKGARMINVPGFDKLFYSVPSKIMIGDLTATPVTESPVKFRLGSNHRVGLDYGVIVMPLLFGQDMQLDYEHDLPFDLGIIPEGINTLVLSSDVLSSLPFDMSFSAKALDVHGNAVSTISSEVVGNIIGGNLNAPKTSPIEIMLKTEGADPEIIKAIRIHLHAEMSNGIKLATLNDRQYIKFDRITAGIRDGFSMDINR